MTDRVRLRRGTADDLPRLEPLWVAVHRQHVASMPELAPYVTDEQSWAERRKLYAELLAEPGTALFLACDGEDEVGYGLGFVKPAGETWVADTWSTGAVVGEIESLGVLPAYRGRGIGTRLLAAVEAALSEAGARDLVLGVLPGNTAAIRLYESRGYRPTWLYLSRLEGR